MPMRPPVHRQYPPPPAPEPRTSRSARGYDWRWAKLRAAYLAANPLCARHQAQGQVVAATEVHHIEPIASAPARRLDWSNLEPLCRPCHSRETARAERP